MITPVDLAAIKARLTMYANVRGSVVVPPATDGLALLGALEEARGLLAEARARVEMCANIWPEEYPEDVALLAKLDAALGTAGA